MSRQLEEIVRCDAADCRKTPGAGDNAHIVVTVAHRPPDSAPANAVPNDQLNGTTLDFCSWEHAAQFMADAGKERKTAYRDAKRAEG